MLHEHCCCRCGVYPTFGGAPPAYPLSTYLPSPPEPRPVSGRLGPRNRCLGSKGLETYGGIAATIFSPRAASSCEPGRFARPAITNSLREPGYTPARPRTQSEAIGDCRAAFSLNSTPCHHKKLRVASPPLLVPGSPRPSTPRRILADAPRS